MQAQLVVSRQRVFALGMFIWLLRLRFMTEESLFPRIFDQYGIGARKAFATPNLISDLNLKVNKLSTGDSLDMSPQDEESILANEAAIKDMEGAAVAYVTDMLSVPAIFVKAVTDIVDGDKPTAEFGRGNCCTLSNCYQDNGFHRWQMSISALRGYGIRFPTIYAKLGFSSVFSLGFDYVVPNYNETL